MIVSLLNTTSNPLSNDPDIRNTLNRIKAQKPKYDGHDGKTYLNSNHMLPSALPGYYICWTVDTPGQKKRALRRLVLGARGEIYYTPDHYHTFVRLK